MALVVDASVGLKWALQGPDSHLAQALALLEAQVEPTPTTGMKLHAIALEIGLSINHSPYDTTPDGKADPSSWPGLTRPSTHVRAERRRKRDPAQMAGSSPAITRVRLSVRWYTRTHGESGTSV